MPCPTGQISLDNCAVVLNIETTYSGAVYGLTGNPVKFRDGPAAVIGDENRNNHCGIFSWEGAVFRLIQESEDLPGMEDFPSW